MNQNSWWAPVWGLHNWLALMYYLQLQLFCASVRFPCKAPFSLNLYKPRLVNPSSNVRLPKYPESFFTCLWLHLFDLSNIEADQNCSAFSKHDLTCWRVASFICSSLLELHLKIVFAFRLLPNIVQMVWMSHHCRPFIFWTILGFLVGYSL